MQSYSDYGNIIFSGQWIEKWMNENCRSDVLIRCVGQAQNIGSNTNLVGGNKVHGVVNGTTSRRQNMIIIQNCASAEGIVRQIDCNLKSFVVVESSLWPDIPLRFTLHTYLKWKTIKRGNGTTIYRKRHLDAKH